ncbi:hypothetical protein [Lysobacter terrae]
MAADFSRILTACCAALALSLGVSACAPAPRWSMAGVLNREQGAVVVWRQARYRGGGFNGFDNDPVVVDSASFRATSIREAAVGLHTEDIPVVYRYDSRTGASPDPDFVIGDGGLDVARCHGLLTQQGACSYDIGSGPRVFQAGERGERLSLNGNDLVVGAESEPCTIALPAQALAIDAKGGPYDLAALAVVRYPARDVTYLAAAEGRVLNLWLATGCSGFAPVSFEYPAMRGSEEVHSLSMIDIVPSADPMRPAVLLHYYVRRPPERLYQEERVIVDAEGRVHPIPQVHPIDMIVGFWQGAANQVLLYDLGQITREDGMDFTLLDTTTAQTRTLHVSR